MEEKKKNLHKSQDLPGKWEAVSTDSQAGVWKRSASLSEPEEWHMGVFGV